MIVVWSVVCTIVVVVMSGGAVWLVKRPRAARGDEISSDDLPHLAEDFGEATLSVESASTVSDSTERYLPRPVGPPVPGRHRGLRQLGSGPTVEAAPRLSLNVQIVSVAGARRKVNEDQAWASPDAVVLADGVGGDGRGRVASETVVAISRTLLASVATRSSEGLEHAGRKAHKELLTRDSIDISKAGPTSTLDMVRLVDDELVGLHVGDAFVWSVDDTNEPRLLTSPHVDSGGRLLRTVGNRDGFFYDSWNVPARPGERLVLATDGYWKPLGSKIATRLVGATHGLAPHVTAQILVDAAMRARSSDDVTVVVADVVEPEPA